MQSQPIIFALLFLLGLHSVNAQNNADSPNDLDSKPTGENIDMSEEKPNIPYPAEKQNPEWDEKLNKTEYNDGGNEIVNVELAAPVKAEINHPDIRLLARLAVAMVQNQLYKNTPYEKEGIYEGRAPNHVDMPFPKMNDLNEVIKIRQKVVDARRELAGKLQPKHKGPPKPPPGVRSPDQLI